MVLLRLILNQLKNLVVVAAAEEEAVDVTLVELIILP
jgi:hypothetical protein